MSKSPETLTIEECEIFLKFLSSQIKNEWSCWRNHRNSLMALLMLDAGLRVGEVVKLTVGNLVLGRAPITALDLSSSLAEKGCHRLVPLSGRVQTAISSMRSLVWLGDFQVPERYAFFDSNSQKHISIRQVERIIKYAGQKSIGRPIHPHVLRHTFATRLMRVTSTRVVQELLGHKNLSSTQIYTHPNGDDCKKAIESMP